MRMRQFLIALAAAVLLASIAVPAAGQNTQPDGEIVPSTNPEIPFVHARQAPEDYPGWTGWDDCVVTVAVEVTSNVRSQLDHTLTGPGEDEVWGETVLLKKDVVGELVMLDLLVKDQLGEEFLVDYYAELSSRSGPFAWLATEEEPVTCEPFNIPLPPTALAYVITSMGRTKTWSAEVEAINFADPPADPDFVVNGGMEGQFGEDARVPGSCALTMYEEHHWRCTWTSPTFDKKTDEVTFRAYIDGESDPVCWIDINRGSEFGSVECP